MTQLSELLNDIGIIVNPEKGVLGEHTGHCPEPKKVQSIIALSSALSSLEQLW